MRQGVEHVKRLLEMLWKVKFSWHKAHSLCVRSLTLKITFPLSLKVYKHTQTMHIWTQKKEVPMGRVGRRYDWLRKKIRFRHEQILMSRDCLRLWIIEHRLLCNPSSRVDPRRSNQFAANDLCAMWLKAFYQLPKGAAKALSTESFPPLTHAFLLRMQIKFIEFSLSLVLTI